MTPNRTAAVVSEDGHRRDGGRWQGARRGRPPRPRAQQGLARSLGAAARHPARRRPHRPTRRRRRRRSQPEQRRAHRQGQPGLPRRLGADHGQGRGRRRRRTPSPTPRASSTRRATRAGGTGFQLVAVDGKLDSLSESVYGLIPISQVKALTNGTHHVFVRGKDTAGNWGRCSGSTWSSTRRRRCSEPWCHAQPHERGGDADPHGADRRDVLRGRRVLARQHRPRCGKGPGCR